MVFSADRKVKEGFPPADPNAPAVRDDDFTYLRSGTWRVEGDVLIREMNNQLLVDRYEGYVNDPKPKLEHEIHRDRIVAIDGEKMLFGDGFTLRRVK